MDANRPLLKIAFFRSHKGSDDSRRSGHMGAVVFVAGRSVIAIETPLTTCKVVVFIRGRCACAQPVEAVLSLAERGVCAWWKSSGNNLPKWWHKRIMDLQFHPARTKVPPWINGLLRGPLLEIMLAHHTVDTRTSTQERQSIRNEFFRSHAITKLAPRKFTLVNSGLPCSRPLESSWTHGKANLASLPGATTKAPLFAASANY